jgi:predicted nucleic acid-binding protein
LILYLDTSSLVKLYVEEVHSSVVKEWVEDAELVATCRVAHPETLSAFHRRFQSGDFSKPDFKILTAGFVEDWRKYVAVDFDETEAGLLVGKYGLKGFDAVHLSSAKMMRQDADLDLFFSSFDNRLNNAAAAEGFQVLLPE